MPAYTIKASPTAHKVLKAKSFIDGTPISDTLDDIIKAYLSQPNLNKEYREALERAIHLRGQYDQTT